MKLKRKIINFFVAIAMVIGSMPIPALSTFAADETGGIVPEEENIPKSLKKVKANNDGTYDITLEIEGVSKQKNDATKANVVVVFDSSGSMNEEATTYSYSESASGRYRKVDDDYVQLYRRSYGSCSRMDSDNSSTQVYATYNDCVNRTNLFTGTRYTRTTIDGTRLTVAKSAVNVLANELLSQNDPSTPGLEDVVEMAFVDFATNVKTNTTHTTPTTDLDTFKGWVNATNYGGGTNWEAALTTAKSISFGDDDKTYIIFVSDGNPTFRDSKYNSNATDNCYTDGWSTICDEVWGNGRNDNNGWNFGAAKDVADEIIGTENVEFYTVGTFGDATNMQNLGGTYYNATDQDALEEAFAEIVDKIKMGLSVADLQIEDGITPATSTEVDGTAGNFRYSVPDSWGDDWGKASFEGGSVHWNPGEHKTLSNGEKASVTFTVWPSQEAMDCIASIRNDGTCDESDLTKFGLGVNSDGSFRLITNNTATFRFKTATKNEDTGETTYSDISIPIDFDEERDPTNLPETTLDVVKVWLDSMDADQRDDISDVTVDLFVDREDNPDQERHYTFTKGDGSGNEWVGEDENGKSEYTVAPGVMKKLDGTPETEGLRGLGPVVKVGNDEYVVLETGRDYEFDNEQLSLNEDGSNHYHITKRKYHPMIIGEGGNIHDVVFSEDGKTATIEDGVLTKLSLENTLNGGILVGKTVINNDKEDKTIEDEYDITIALSEDTGVYRIYTYNPDGTEKERSEKKTYTGGVINEKITVNQKIRVQDVPTGTTYEVTEVLPNGYTKNEVDYTVVMYDGTEDKEGVQEVFGNASSQATVTNYLESGDLIISKEVVVNSGNESKAKNQEFNFTIKFYEKQGDATPIKTDTETCKAIKDGDSCEIKNIPKGWYYEIIEEAKAGFNDGEETVKTGTIKRGDNEEEFENVYEVTPIEESIFARKGFTNEIFWLPSDNFTFQLKYNELVEDNSIVNLDQKTATFTVTISDEGEYQYTITESEEGFREGVSRVENDEDVVWTLVAEDNGDGTLTLKSKTSSKDGQTIYNQYKGNATYGTEKELEFEKVLEGRDWNNDDEFTFTISSEDEDAPMPKNKQLSVKKSTAGHKIDFGTISFTEEDVNRVYHYTVTESFDTSKIQSVTPADDIKEGISFTIKVEYTTEGKLSLVVSDYENTFTNIYETTTKTAKKIWSDDNDRDGKRSDYDNLYVAVKDGDTFVAYGAISGDDEQDFTFTGLQEKRDGEVINYSIVEAKDCSTSNNKITCTEFTEDGVYTASIDGTTITNTHTPETKKIKIKKTWEVPESGLPTTAPTFIMVEMTNDDNDEVKTIRLEGNGYGEWESDEIEVLAYKNQGEDITYEVKETGINGSSLIGDNKDTLYIYDGEILEGKWTAESAGALEVKNTWTPATPVYEGSTEFYIRKIDESDEIMPGVEFEINGKSYITDSKGEIKFTVPADTATKEDDLEYKIEEIETEYGYDLVEGIETLKVTSTSSFVEADAENLVNKYKKTYSFSPKGIEGYTWDNKDTYIVTNYRSRAQSLIIEKTFSGVSAEALKDLTFTITGPSDFGEEGEMTIKFSDCEIDGNTAICEVDTEIYTGDYTVKENNAELDYFKLVTTGDNGVTKEVESDDEVVFKIDNKYTAETTSYIVTKVWEDNHDQDGKRPEELTVKLKANGKTVETEVLTSEDKTSEEELPEGYEAEDIWTVTWDKLPIADENAKVIEYTAKEYLESEDYEAIAEFGDEYSTTFVNLHDPELINETGEIKVTKIWEDGENKLGIRPGSILVILLADGEEIDSAEVSENEDGVWAYTFEGLYKYNEGNEIEYTVEEGALSDDYSTKVEGDAEKGFVITNRSTDPCVFGGCGGNTPDTGRFTTGKEGSARFDNYTNYMTGGIAVVMGGIIMVVATKRKSGRK